MVHTVKCGLFQTDGVLVEKWEIPTRKENSGEAILPDIAKTILDKIAERKLDKEEIDGVGIGVPGPVNERGEVPCAVNLFWGFKEVTKELTELTGLPSKAGNDANVAALGEAWKGAAAGAKNVILVTLGTGVGGGMIGRASSARVLRIGPEVRSTVFALLICNNPSCTNK